MSSTFTHPDESSFPSHFLDLSLTSIPLYLIKLALFIIKSLSNALISTSQKAMATLDAGTTVSWAASAAQRVMSLPEMVSEILDWMEVDNLSPSQLAKLARTNRVWYSEAMRRLWKHGTEVKGCSLPEVLGKLQEGQHRLLHASWIQSGNLVNIWKGNVAEKTRALRGLKFTRLEYLAIIIRNTPTQRFQMPRINAPMVKILDIRLAQWEKRWTPNFTFVRDNYAARLRYLHEHIVTSLIRMIKKDFKSLQVVMLGCVLLEWPDFINRHPHSIGWTVIKKRFEDELPGIQITQYLMPRTGANLLESLGT
ncbi:hypothetical protein N7540_009429 [Penicillium herquei]|nr:hypothetical protein N7540_009429 [Penicillium herquei]